MGEEGGNEEEEGEEEEYPLAGSPGGLPSMMSVVGEGRGDTTPAGFIIRATWGRGRRRREVGGGGGG